MLIYATRFDSQDVLGLVLEYRFQAETRKNIFCKNEFWESGPLAKKLKNIANGTGGVGFDYLANQIRHGVANGLSPLRRYRYGEINYKNLTS